jgi:hypothetical protein
VSNHRNKGAARAARSDEKAPDGKPAPESSVRRAPAPPRPIRRVATRPGDSPQEELTRLSTDADENESPPLHGKSNPKSDMGFVELSSDDDTRNLRHHPNDSGVVDFEVDPDRADAAADLAGDLGMTFLEAAVEGEETTEHVVGEPERASEQKSFLFDEETEGMYEEVLDEDLLDEEREEGHDDVRLAPGAKVDPNRRPEDIEKPTAHPKGTPQKP